MELTHFLLGGGLGTIDFHFLVEPIVHYERVGHSYTMGLHWVAGSVCVVSYIGIVEISDSFLLRRIDFELVKGELRIHCNVNNVNECKVRVDCELFDAGDYLYLFFSFFVYLGKMSVEIFLSIRLFATKCKNNYLSTPLHNSPFLFLPYL